MQSTYFNVRGPRVFLMSVPPVFTVKVKQYAANYVNAKVAFMHPSKLLIFKDVMTIV